MIIFASVMKKFLLLAALGLLAACAPKETPALLVGTYADAFYALDPVSGEVIGEAVLPNPSFLALAGNKVYAVSEMPDSSASVSAWRFGGNGFAFLNARPSGLNGLQGEDPCHVAVCGKLLAVSNYSGGTLALFRLTEEGFIAPMDSLVVSGTGGPDPVRQDRPHVHCSVFSPDGKHLFFSEFSADAIGGLDLVGGQTPRNYRRAAALPADFGPRHLLFDGRGERLYVIGELSGDIAVFDHEAGRLTLRQIVRADETGARGAADLHLSPDGRFLYASLRLQNDGIAVFAVHPDGSLEKTGYQRTGAHPRHFAVTEKEVAVACRDADCVEIYERDPRNGQLRDSGRRLRVPRPAFVAFSSR